MNAPDVRPRASSTGLSRAGFAVLALRFLAGRTLAVLALACLAAPAPLAAQEDEPGDRDLETGRDEEEDEIAPPEDLPPGRPAKHQRPPEERAPRTAIKRPPYHTLRYEEDWSFLAGRDRLESGDPFDPIKYVPLTEDGEVWVSFGGQIRLRHESWDDFGFGGPGDRDDDFLLSRFRYHADIHATRYVRGFIEGKSAFSTERDLPGGRRTVDVDELDLQNGFIDLNLPIDDASELTLRSGRQELLFGKQRLVSPLDWSNTRRTFDGFRGIYESGGLSVSAFYTQLVSVDKYDFNESDGGTELFGIYATREVLGKDLAADVYFLGLVRDLAAFNGTTGEEDRFTLGARAGGLLGDTGLDYDVEAAYQFGEVGDGDITAYMITGEAGYALPDVEWTPRVHAGAGYASGDDDPGGDVETFNQLFPLGHAYLGFIDVIGRQNIIDLRAGITVEPLPKLEARLDGHYFLRADDDDALYNAGGGVVRPGGAGGSSEVGGEIDLLITYVFYRHLLGFFGYSHFFPGDFIEESGPGDDIDFVYVGGQLTF